MSRQASHGVGTTFDPAVDYSPFRLYALLRTGSAPLLFDLRRPGARPSLVSARPVPAGGLSVYPDRDAPVVVFDDDGTEARALVLALRRGGRNEVKALYGGLVLWRLCFPAEVVGETFLVD